MATSSLKLNVYYLQKYRDAIMCFHILIGILVLISNRVKGERFTISNERTLWNETTCTLGAPNLVYSTETGWTVDKSTLNITQCEEVWIGYVKATFALEYQGCADVNVSEGNTFVVNTSDECYITCRSDFGIQKFNTRIRCWCFHPAGHLSKPFCTDTCGPQPLLCGKEHKSYFSVYRVTHGVRMVRDTGENYNNCLVFNPANGYIWRQCNVTNKVLCRILRNGRTAEVQNGIYKQHWFEANSYCLRAGKLPATLESITNANFTSLDIEDFWTGYLRTSSVIKANDPVLGLLHETEHVQFAYMSPDGRVAFTDSGQRRSICNASTPSERTHFPSFLDCITDITQAKDGVHQTETTNKEFLAVGVGIGVPVGIVLAIGVVAVIVLLRNRRLLPCLKTTSTTCHGRQTFQRPEASYEDMGDRNEGKTNYCVLDRNADSVEGNARYYNSSSSLNTEHVEGDNCSKEIDNKVSHENAQDVDVHSDYMNN